MIFRILSRHMFFTCVIATLGALTLTSCGGSSGGDTPPIADPPPPPPPPPIVETSGLTLLLDSDESNLISVASGELSDHRIFLAKKDDSISAQLSMESETAGISITFDNNIPYLSVDTNILPVGATPITIVATNLGNGLQETVDATIDVLDLVVVASGSIGSRGGVVATPGGMVGVRIDDGELTTPVGIEIRGALTSNGDAIVRIQFDRDVSTELARLSFTSNTSATSLDETAGNGSEKLLTGTFTKLEAIGLAEPIHEFFGYYVSGLRLDLSARPISELVDTCRLLSRAPNQNTSGSMICVVRHRDAAVLSSSMTAAQLAALKQDTNTEVVPVLFVNGFMPLNRLGGGPGTWDEFPQRVENMSAEGIEFVPFEFQWRTNASFRVVADDLNAAIMSIHRLTDRPVRVVAHSFGGVLVRTLLQGQAQTATNFDARYIRSLLTLGTPHSGIYEEETAGTKYGRVFPDGQDSLIWGCFQISCWQTGEHVAPLNLFPGFTSAGDLGEVIEDLAEAPYPDDVPTVIGIGLKREAGDNDIYDEGDGLITYLGQRFIAGVWVNTENGLEPLPLARCDSASGDLVAEVLLGAGDLDLRPGDDVVDNATGYSHSTFGPTDPDNRFEYHEAKVQAGEVPHDSVERFRSMIDPDDSLLGSCVPTNYTVPNFGTSLFGTTVELTAHYPNIGDAWTVPYSAIVSDSMEFPFGVIQDANSFDNLTLIRGNIDVGPDFIDEIYIDTARASSGNFNGWVFELTDADSPTIVNATLNTTLSSFSTSEIRVTYEAKRIMANGEGVFISAGDRIYIDIELE